MDVTETLLPGVGVRYEFDTARGGRVGVVSYRDGRFELVRYDADDPDSCDSLLILASEEADTIAEIMGAPRITERFADLTREIPGLASATVDIPDGSLFDGAPLGDTSPRRAACGCRTWAQPSRSVCGDARSAAQLGSIVQHRGGLRQAGTAGDS